MNDYEFDKRIRRDIRKIAVVLDSELPGWHNDIDVETLNMGDSTRCIVGQLYGWWSDEHVEPLAQIAGITLDAANDATANFLEDWLRQIDIRKLASNYSKKELKQALKLARAK